MSTILLALALACGDMTAFHMPGMDLTITKAEKPSDNLPARCRVDGVIDQRIGAGGKPYGIGFAVALPDNWNGRFLFQGGGALNGSVRNPVGDQTSGDATALSRGFAIVTTDTGHKGTGGFDSSFMADQQAQLDFYYVAIGRVAPLAKEIITRYYGRAPDHSYYVGCSTGGREAMLMSQRYPTYFDGIVAGDPAIRTGHSNLGLAHFAAAMNGVDPKLSDMDKKLVVDAIVNSCDEKDGLKDGMIFNTAACNFNPAALTCNGAKAENCLSASQAAGIQKAFAGPKDSRGNSIYPAFPYDAGVIDPGNIAGILRSGGSSPVNRPSTSSEYDAEKAAFDLAANATARTGDALWTNLSTFSGHGGKLIFYHGMSDPWFSPLDTVGYYERMSKENGGMDKMKDWSRLFLVPGMGHCQGGTSTIDSFDMLTAIVNWVESGKAPEAVAAKSRTQPSRSRPLCPYPAYAQYSGQGDPQSASSFACRN